MILRRCSLLLLTGLFLSQLLGAGCTLGMSMGMADGMQVGMAALGSGMPTSAGSLGAAASHPGDSPCDAMPGHCTVAGPQCTSLSLLPMLASAEPVAQVLPAAPVSSPERAPYRRLSPPEPPPPRA